MTYFCAFPVLATVRPFETGRIARSSAPAQAALDNFVHHFLWRHFAQDIVQCLVSVRRDVRFDAFRINVAAVREDNGELFGEKRAFRDRRAQWRRAAL